jgi:hypothetical protein
MDTASKAVIVDEEGEGGSGIWEGVIGVDGVEEGGVR